MQAEGDNEKENNESLADNESIQSNRSMTRVAWTGLHIEEQSMYTNEA